MKYTRDLSCTIVSSKIDDNHDVGSWTHCLLLKSTVLSEIEEKGDHHVDLSIKSSLLSKPRLCIELAIRERFQKKWSEGVHRFMANVIRNNHFFGSLPITKMFTRFVLL